MAVRGLLDMINNALGLDLNKRVKEHPICFLSGPVSYNAQFKNNWNNCQIFIDGDNIGDAVNEYFEPVKDGDYYVGIKILKTGIYECEYLQRGSGNDNAEYGVLAIDGNRLTIEQRYGDSSCDDSTADNNCKTGPWTHDHSGGDNNWSKSYYYGRLEAGELLTGGANENEDGYMGWYNMAFVGRMYVKLIKEL